MPSPPVIGVCAALEPARWSVWDMPAALVPANYLEHVRDAGGIALLVPPDPALAEHPGLVLDRLDGLMLIGGVDIDAALYGAARHPEADAPIAQRDAVEIALARAAMERGLPLLGICRGAQVVNVARGGTLTQHLPDSLGHTGHRRATGRFAGNEHDVRTEPGTRARAAAGEEVHRAVSHHHQAIDGVGRGLRVSARALDDGLPEAVEAEGEGWVLGVQWHPEADPHSRVIAALVAAAASRRRDPGWIQAKAGEKGADSPA